MVVSGVEFAGLFYRRINSYIYDMENLRFELLENGRRTSFVYHNGELPHEEGGNEKQSSYYLGAGIDALQRGKELSYYHRDEQLGMALITGGHGEIQNSYLYDAFGAELETNEQFPNRICYTGPQYDEFTEQYYLRARYYNPVLGRFMQEDAYQGDDLNLYAYCGNNPVIYFDPSGYMKQKDPDCELNGNISEGMGDAEPDTEGGSGAYQGGSNVIADGGYSSLRDLMTPEEASRYDAYWKQGAGSFHRDTNGNEIIIGSGGSINTRQRLQVSPGIQSITDVKYGSNVDMYYRQTLFDEFGRRIGNNDYTDHNRSNAHTNPHHHSNPPTSLDTHSRPMPGLHPKMP